MNRFISLAIALMISAVASSKPLPEIDSSRWQPDDSIVFATYGEQQLSMDVYYPEKDDGAPKACIVFIYGGGFIHDNQKSVSTRQFCRTLADKDNFVAVAINYRLGLKGAKFSGALGMIDPLEKSIHMAVEDCSKAVAYITGHSAEMRIDPARIILCGSSAGAITALQTDYELCNRTANVAVLPEGFRFAGVASFAGAIFSRSGKAEYKLHSPAPTMMLHGTADKLVTYKKIAFFNTRFSGSSDLINTFKKNHYPHLFIRFEDEGHGVAGRMMDNYDQLMWFIDNMVTASHNYEMDMTWSDHDHTKAEWDNSSPDKFYR